MRNLHRGIYREGKIDPDFARLSARSTEFFFPDMGAQVSRGIRDHCHETGQRPEDDCGFLFETGGAVVTRHSNLCGLNLGFHMARDCDYDVEAGPGAGGAEVVLSPCISDDEKIDGSLLRERLCKGLKNVVCAAAASGVAALYIPCDLYCPTGEGFGTRDFGALVRDVRASVMELISAQRRQERQHLKCVRFVLSQKAGAVEDELLIKSMTAMLEEKFTSDMFKELR